MKLTSEVVEVTRSKKFETVNYGVDTSNLPMLFSLLRTNLYSNVRGSIIRELVSNVVDAHTEAGKPDAVGEIEWVDQNTLLGIDCQLIIRDFGVGLSPERMRTIYGNYLSSTKRDSNDQIGGFGLGSKSPFAYTDSFFVQTVFDGIKYKYLCYIDETQLGSISNLLEVETTEPNGTEIIIPIKKPSEDKQSFSQAIQDQLPYFKNLKFINIEKPKTTILHEEEDFVIVENGIRDLHIILGTVAYTINYDSMRINHYGLNYLGCCIGLKFGIGELQPTMSREGLFYTEASINKINAKINKVKNRIKSLIEDEMNSQTDYLKWAISVSTKTTGVFYNQWAFSGASSGLVFKSIKGLEVPSTYFNKCFPSFNIRSVTPYSSYRRRTSKNPPLYEANTVRSFSTLVNMPIYKTVEGLSSDKVRALFKKHKDGFILINETEEVLNKDEKQYYKATKASFENLPSFDDVQGIVDDSPSNAMEKEEYRILLKERKVNGIFTPRKLRCTDMYSKYITGSNYCFNKEEYTYEFIANQNVIYGTFDQADKLTLFAQVIAMNPKQFENFNKDRLYVLKVSKDAADKLSLLENAHSIDDVFAFTTPHAKPLQEMIASFNIKADLTKFHVLNSFGEIDSKTSLIYSALLEKTMDNSTKVANGDVSDFLLDNFANADEDMMKAFHSLEDFMKKVPLLRMPPFDIVDRSSGYNRHSLSSEDVHVRQYVSMNKEGIISYLIDKGFEVDVMPEEETTKANVIEEVLEIV